MLRHVVLFSLQDFANEEEKVRQLFVIKRELEALPSLIPSLHALRVFFNQNPAETYDFLLEADVESLEELSLYANHPEHIRVANDFIKPYIKARACVDYKV